MTAADIAAARARVVETAAGLRLSAGWTMQPASGRELLARDHALALSDLLLAMTAPEPAPAEPSLPAAVVPWVTALREVWPEMRATQSERSEGFWLFGTAAPLDALSCDALLEPPWCGGAALLGGKHERALRRYTTPAALVAALRKTLGQEPVPANYGDGLEPEARTVAELTGPTVDRLFAMGAMEKAPCFACGYNGPGYYQPATHPCAERHHRLAKSDTSRPVRPPAPAGPPSLWEWVRAACVSRLGEPRMHTLRGGALQWVLPHTVIWALRDDQANGGVWRVQRDSGETMGATCAAPAELTAALDALAEEVGRG